MTTTSVIGLTGGIGTGKSFVADGLRKAGYPVYNSDREAQRIIHDNPCVRSQIELLFGSDIFKNDRYDKRRVAELVFQEPALLDKLNRIVHPAVAFDFGNWVKNADAPVVFIESAILYESGFDRLCKAVVCICAPEETRIRRVMQRDGITRGQVVARMHNQAADRTKAERADLTVCNDGTQEIETLCLQIQNFCRTFVD